MRPLAGIWGNLHIAGTSNSSRLPGMPEPRTVFIAAGGQHAPEWDGVPCAAQRVLVKVLNPHGDGAPVPNAWYRELIGTERPAVEVVVPDGVPDEATRAGLGRPGQVLYIDDDRGWGWAKVTQRHGSRHVVSGIYHRVRVLDVFE